MIIKKIIVGVAKASPDIPGTKRLRVLTPQRLTIDPPRASWAA
ncbi:hypothetical protein [Endozoicomonas sp. ALB091]